MILAHGIPVVTAVTDLTDEPIALVTGPETTVARILAIAGTLAADAID